MNMQQNPAAKSATRVPASLAKRGFLPLEDPVCAFPAGSELSVLDELGRDLPSLLHDHQFRSRAEKWVIPRWPEPWAYDREKDHLRLYYVRLGFLASAYINQVGEDRAKVLPANIAVPLTQASNALQRPPILSYDGYALYNWKRFRKQDPIALGNIDTIQNFVHLYDEHWFILVHVEIEAIAADILAAVSHIQAALASDDLDVLNRALQTIAASVWKQVAVLRRIPEKMDARLYFKTFRPYIRYFEDVIYRGVDLAPIHFRGETGAQSSIMPALVLLMKIPHQESSLTNHLLDMRNYMPADHRDLLQHIENLPNFKDRADKDAFNDILDAMATFREVHYHWANEYIHRMSKDNKGTGGTPYILWLKQLIDETRAHAK